jgi:parvulin-like peptidyl-prolyl isomerase
MRSALALLWVVCAGILLAVSAVAQAPAPSPDSETVDSAPVGTGFSITVEESTDEDAAEEVSDSQDAESPAAEISMLNRRARLDSDEAYVDGDKVIWTDKGAYISGDAFIRFENMTLQADEVWTDLRKALRAKGNVRLTVDEEITFADELVFDFLTKKGIAQGGAAYGAPWYYQGYEILRVSETESLIKDGILTTSSLKHPHTYFRASRILVNLGEEIIAKHVVFMIGGVPLLYLPVYRRSLKEKKPAALIVKVGSDSYQGNWTSIQLPLVRNSRARSVLQFDWSSLRGTGQGFETKYNIRDVNARLIFLPYPEDATPEDRTTLKRRAQDVNGRLRGDQNRQRLQRLFVPFDVTEEDERDARATADEAVAAVAAGDTDFGALASTYSDDDATKNDEGVLGYLAPGDAVLLPQLEPVVMALGVGETTSLIETPGGFYLFHVADILKTRGRVEKKVQVIYIAIQASDDAKEVTREAVDELVREAKGGADFSAMIAEHAGTIPRSALTTSEREVLTLNPPTEVWLQLDDFEWAQRRAVRDMEPGEVTSAIEVREGILVLRMIEEEETPDFAALARDISAHESAEDGGLIGWTGPADVPKQVYNSSRGLEQGEVSSVIETPDGFYVVKSEGRRNIQGEATLFRKDLRSFGRENTFRTGTQWDMQLRHQQDVPMGWERRGKRVAFWTRLDFGSRDFKEGMGTDRSELRAFGVLTFDSNPTRPEDLTPSFRSRLTMDKTFDFAEGTGTVQKLPELTSSWGGQLQRVWGFRQLHRKMDDVADKVEDWELGPLRFPTLVSTTFSLDGSLGNLFRDKFRYADSVRAIRAARGLDDAPSRDVYLRTVDVGMTLRKDSDIDVSATHVVKLSMDGSTQMVWHGQDQKGNKNIVRSVFSASAGASNNLFRVYDIGWIPGVSRMRHDVTTSAKFDWAPSVNDVEPDPDNPDPDLVKLYPFGSSTYLFERKFISLNLQSAFKIKTRQDKTINGLTLSLRTSRDFSERVALRDRKWEFITGNARFSPLPSGNLSGTMNASWDPNTYGPTSTIQRPAFSMVQFSSSVRYKRGDYRQGWGSDFGTQYQRLTGRSQRNLVFGFDWRPSRLFRIDVDTRFEYDRHRLDDEVTIPAWRDSDLWKALRVAYLHPFSQQVALTRNLRDWDLRITWRRSGSVGNVRKEFTYQVNLIADPSITVGAGFDAVTNRWGLRSLPIGVPPTFSGGSLGRSRF